MKKIFLSVIAFVSFVAISSAKEISKDSSKVEILKSDVKGLCSYRVKHTMTNSQGEVISTWYTYHTIEADSLQDCQAKLLAL
jgi:hypothetical protein